MTGRDKGEDIVLNNKQWLQLGIDWEQDWQPALGILEICDKVSFRPVRQSNGFSIYHRVCGGSGQFQFSTEEETKNYLETQLNAKKEYTQLIAKREALTARVNPLHKKLNIVNAQIDAILFAR